MKTTVQRWVVAYEENEAIGLASHALHRFDSYNEVFLSEESATYFLSTCRDVPNLHIYPVTLTIEVGDPAEKGGAK